MYEFSQMLVMTVEFVDVFRRSLKRKIRSRVTVGELKRRRRRNSFSLTYRYMTTTD